MVNSGNKPQGKSFLPIQLDYISIFQSIMHQYLHLIIKFSNTVILLATNGVCCHIFCHQQTSLIIILDISNQKKMCSFLFVIILKINSLNEMIWEFIWTYKHCTKKNKCPVFFEMNYHWFVKCFGSIRSIGPDLFDLVVILFVFQIQWSSRYFRCPN